MSSRRRNVRNEADIVHSIFRTQLLLHNKYFSTTSTINIYQKNSIFQPNNRPLDTPISLKFSESSREISKNLGLRNGEQAQASPVARLE